MTTEEHAKLSALAQEIQDPEVCIVLLVLAGNASCGASNRPIADFCTNVAKQMLADITS